MNIREKINRRAALEVKSGEVVHLGFGMPMGVMNYVEKDRGVIFQTENGALMFGPTPRLGEHDSDTGNAGGLPITLMPGAACFDLATSFGIIRGGHVTTAILGTLEVSQTGDIANWSMPGKSPGMGGAMDLVVGAQRIIAILQHTDKSGSSKILKNCTLPLTGKGVVDIIITDKAVFEVTDSGLVLKEIDEGCTVEELRNMTDADFIADNPGVYRIV